MTENWGRDRRARLSLARDDKTRHCERTLVSVAISAYMMIGNKVKSLRRVNRVRLGERRGNPRPL